MTNKYKILYPYEYRYAKHHSYNPNLLLNYFEEQKCIQIVSGQVQSGKTQKIIDIIQLAFRDFNYDIVFFISGTITNLKKQTDERLENNSFPDNIIIKNELKDSQTDISAKCLFSILKQKEWIENMHLFINNNKNKKILIIDDECDYATVNTSSIEDRKCINKIISSSYEELVNGGLILVSATPMANILNEISFNETIKYIWLANVNNNYTGLEFFNQLKNFYLIIPNKNDKLLYTLYIYIVNSYKYFNYENVDEKDKKSQLLIYSSSKNQDHVQIREQLYEILYNNFEEEMIRLNNIYKLINSNELENNILKDDRFSSIRNHLLISIKILNQNNPQYDLNSKYQILIGGNYFSRGITYEYLTVELLDIDSSNPSLDTWLQRCRWFGYKLKNNKYKYMNVITTKDIKNIYLNCQKNIQFTFNYINGACFEYQTFRELLNVNEQIRNTDARKIKQ